MLKITLDTNTVRPEQMSAAIRKIRGGADVATTTTVVREIGSVYDPSLYRLHVVPALWVMGESPLGVAALVSEADRDLFEAILAAITNGSFPKPDRRATLTQGERNQMRDAMIFCTHIREARDIFVTNDVKAFGSEGSPQRQRVTGRNIALEIRWAEERLERLPALAADLVRLKVDVIVTHGPAGIRAARDATGTIPIVMGRMGGGWIRVCRQPRATGMPHHWAVLPDRWLSRKWLGLLKEALPRASRAASSGRRRVPSSSLARIFVLGGEPTRP